ncbi:hypothetical protein GQR58_009450 [Nymphon striatum]|nr:hypothetical protein GQR58_009450 [Nymphon striatum]
MRNAMRSMKGKQTVKYTTLPDDLMLFQRQKYTNTHDSTNKAKSSGLKLPIWSMLDVTSSTHTREMYSLIQRQWHQLVPEGSATNFPIAMHKICKTLNGAMSTDHVTIDSILHKENGAIVRIAVAWENWHRITSLKTCTRWGI